MSVPPRKSPPSDDVDQALVDACADRLRTARACPVARVSDVALTPRARQKLVEALLARGFERSGATLRVAVADQLAPLVGPEPLPVNGINRRLAACSNRDIQTALAAGVADGRWGLVVRGKLEAVVILSDSVLSEEERVELGALASELSALARSGKAKRAGRPRSLWRADVAAVLEPSARRLLPLPPRAAAADVTEHVLASVVERADSRTGLASVPHVLRALSARVPLGVARDALLSLARAGRIELRPESGVELLAPELRALCLPGPRGSLLSYARVLPTAEPG